MSTETPSPVFPGQAADTDSDGDERPEILVGAAFAGGLLSALILKRLTRSDDD